MDSDTQDTGERTQRTRIRVRLILSALATIVLVALLAAGTITAIVPKEKVTTRTVLSVLRPLFESRPVREADVREAIHRAGETLDGELLHLLAGGARDSKGWRALRDLAAAGQLQFRRGPLRWTAGVDADVFADDFERRTRLRVLDGWGRPLRVRLVSSRFGLALELCSAGRDGEWSDTLDSDDLIEDYRVRSR